MECVRSVKHSEPQICENRKIFTFNRKRYLCKPVSQVVYKIQDLPEEASHY